MDADLLDEAGATLVLFDCFIEAASIKFDYSSAYARILEHYEKDAKYEGTFHTDEGNRLYDEMRGYVGRFIKGLGAELGYNLYL